MNDCASPSIGTAGDPDRIPNVSQSRDIGIVNRLNETNVPSFLPLQNPRFVSVLVRSIDRFVCSPVHAMTPIVPSSSSSRPRRVLRSASQLPPVAAKDVVVLVVPTQQQQRQRRTAAAAKRPMLSRRNGTLRKSALPRYFELPAAAAGAAVDTNRKKSSNTNKNKTNTANKTNTNKNKTNQTKNTTKVWIVQATLPDIASARTQKKNHKNTTTTWSLVQVSSLAARNEVYRRAAAELEALEQSRMPRHFHGGGGGGGGCRPPLCCPNGSTNHSTGNNNNNNSRSSWTVQVRITDPTTTTTTSSSQTTRTKHTPFFVFDTHGQLQLATWPHILDKIPEPPRFMGYNYYNNRSSSSSRTTIRWCSRCNNNNNNNNKEEEEDTKDGIKGKDSTNNKRQKRQPQKPANTTPTPTTTTLSQLAWHERWRVPLPNITTKWTAPYTKQSFGTRKSALEHAQQLCHDTTLINKVLHGMGTRGQPLLGRRTTLTTTTGVLSGSKRPRPLSYTSRQAVLQAGKLRFQRDGLWVVGQEEAWQTKQPPQTGATTTTTTVSRRPPRGSSSSSRGLAYYLQSRRKEHQQQRLMVLREARIAQKPDDETTSLVVVVEDVEYGNDAACSNSSSSSSSTTLVTTLSNHKEGISEPIVSSSSSSSSEVGTTSASPRPAAPKMSEDHDDVSSGKNTVVEAGVGQKISFTLREADKELRVMWRTCLSEEERKSWTDRAGSSNNNNGLGSSVQHQLDPEGCVTPTTTGDIMARPEPAAETTTQSAPPRETKESCEGRGSSGSASVFLPKRQPLPPTTTALQFRPGISSKWCLNEEQINLCYEESVEHFDQIMRTVKARDLSRELQDGFDLLRERGRGRYDMELPAFETPAFGFLTDLKKTPWMPIVKEILGDEAALIHKGVFLSLQGAETQVYHQDGPHLTTQYQKPCHAINVFVPLVDLTSQGTEFCLGSHILGQEDYDRDCVETPQVLAGTPIIFDYRLGHRGLGNSSQSIRPVVYCTYARGSDGKEFRDKINFSRKRYHAIGQLVSKAPTREERAKMRERAVETQLLEKAIASSMAAS
jgi:hypothetical protein